MDFAMWLKSAAKALLLPPTGLLLLALVGLAVETRYRRSGRALAVIALVALVALSLPIVANMLVHALHAPAPFQPSAAQGAGAIVVFGGGTRRAAPEYEGDTMSALTLERVRYAARVARVTALPVLVSGGAPHGGDTEAVTMARALKEEFGVPVRWIEARSRNTHENALFSAAILRRAGVGKVVLVMHGFDMWRASAELEAEGIDVIPAATNLPAERNPHLLDWLPSMNGLMLSYYALYEILANLNRSVVTLGTTRQRGG